MAFRMMSFVIAISVAFLCSSDARRFYVGEDEGWIVDPSNESYNHWAKRNRFQMNDTLGM